MARVIFSVLGLIVLLALLAWGALYLSLQSVRSWPEKTAVDGLSAPVEITWTDQQVPWVHARSPEDQFTALGYVHGLSRTWSVALWRQTARGRLGEWFGDRADRLDRWARQLGWAGRAREAYQQLSEREQSWLEAYARGMNAAFDVRNHRTPELLLLELRLEPWEPWHTLAVEQLIAWLGVDKFGTRSVDSTEFQASKWMAAERQLRDWTRLHDFDHSAAWVVKGPSGRSIAQRQVYGSSALPLLEEVVFTGLEDVELLVSVPGTIMLLAGSSSSHAWAMFPTSSARVDSAGNRVSPEDVRHERIPRRDGSTHETVVRRSSGGLHLSGDWLLQWSGFDAATDFAAWHDLWKGRDNRTSFNLFDGSGLLMNRDGDVQVLGDPTMIRTFAEGVAVGQDQWVDRLLPAMTRGSLVEESSRSGRTTASRELYSPWADTLRTRMISVLNDPRTWPALQQEALTYVRNWEGTFDGASIGASILDSWLDAYADSTGTLPQMDGQWTGRQRIQLYRAFHRAVDRLVEQYGRDISRWRWELVQPNEQYFPVWAMPEFLPADVADLAHSKYAPIEPSGGGHPSTLRWGASALEQDEHAASAAWEASMSTSAWQRMYVRKSDVPVGGFLKRYLVTRQYPRTFVVDTSGTAVHHVTLQPSSK